MPSLLEGGARDDSDGSRNDRGFSIMRKKPTLSASETDLPCSCGGTLRPFKFEGEYDASAELGLSAMVTGSFLLVKCDRCEGASLAGSMLDALSDEAVLLLLKLERQLSGAESRFLRKAALGIGQAELAGLLGLTRVTVARWEGERSLSAQQDFQLRGLILARLGKASRLGGKWRKRRSELTSLMMRVLDSARTVEAPPSPPPLRLAA